MHDLARDLRKNSTTPEFLLWQYLRNRRFNNLKFKRQYPVGPYIVDFICLSKNLVIELDGQHMDNFAYDNRRTQYLMSHGLEVLRFWNSDIFNNMSLVLEMIWMKVEKG